MIRKKMKRTTERSNEEVEMQQQMQSKYMEYQVMEEQMGKIKEQIDVLANQMNEIQYIIISLDEYESVKKENEILAPISNGIFVKAKTEDTSKLIVNVGNNTMVEKSVEETKAMLEKQLLEVREARSNMVAQYNMVATKFSGLAEDLNAMLGK